MYGSDAYTVRITVRFVFLCLLLFAFFLNFTSPFRASSLVGYYVRGYLFVSRLRPSSLLHPFLQRSSWSDLPHYSSILGFCVPIRSLFAWLFAFLGTWPSPCDIFASPSFYRLPSTTITTSSIPPKSILFRDHLVAYHTFLLFRVATSLPLVLFLASCLDYLSPLLCL